MIGNFVRLPGRFSDYYINPNGEMYHSGGIPVYMHKIPEGYISVTIHQKGGRSTTAMLHRLLALAFVPNSIGRPVEELDVNHINGVKDDNRLCNLEWTSRRANSVHAYRHGFRTDNVWMELHPADRNTWMLSKGDPLWFYSLSEAARFIGVNPASLHEYLNGKNYGVKPYHGWYISYCDNRSLSEFDSGDIDDPYNQMQMSGINQGVEGARNQVPFSSNTNRKLP